MRTKLRLFVAVLCFSILAPLLAPLTVHAATEPAQKPGTFKFIDRSTIVGLKDGQEIARYFDGKNDEDNTYKFSDPNGCIDVITNEGSDGDPANPAEIGNFLWLNPNNSNEGGCKYQFTKGMSKGEVYLAAAKRLDLSLFSTPEELVRVRAAQEGDLQKINIDNRGNAKINYYLIEEAFVVSSDARDTYSREGNSKDFYLARDPDKCKDLVHLDKFEPSTRDPAGWRQLKEEKDSGACEKKDDRLPVYLGNPKLRDTDKDGIPQTKDQVTTTTARGGEGGDSCESKGGSLSWILCPVIELLDNAVQWLDGKVKDLLLVPNPQNIQDDKGINQLQNAWGRIRNISLIILVPIMLVMVLATAVGSNFVDAYTVKRAMPRLFAAVLFISLSWYIMAFLITITNEVGRGLGGLIAQPFGGLDKTLKDIVDVSSGAAVSGGAVIFVGMAAVAGALTFGIIFSFALITVVALLIGFLVLTLRQIIILGLILLAPIAVIGTIFPNTERLWKSWWGNLSKLLLMFPLIVALLASGKAFAYVIDSAGGSLGVGSDGVLKNVMVIVAYIIPFFFIPATFKAGGAMFGTLAGAITSRSSGFFDKQRQKRGELRKEAMERAGSNNRFNRDNRLVKAMRLNSLASWAASPGANVSYWGAKHNVPGLSGKGRAIKSEIDSKTIGQSGKLYEELNAAGFNDKAYRALSGAHAGFTGKNRLRNGATRIVDAETGLERDVTTADALREAGLYGRAPTSFSDIQRTAEILAQSDSDTEKIGANALSGAAGRISTLYSDPEMGKASAQAAGMIGLSAHGFASGEDLATTGNSLIAGGMDAEVAQALVSTAQVAGQRQRPDVKAGYGIVVGKGADGKIKFESGTKEGGTRARALIKTLSAQDLAAAKSGSLEELTPTIKDVLKAPSAIHRRIVAAGPPPEGAPEVEVEAYKAAAKVVGEAQAMEDQLFSWAGPYSQASVDAKRQSLEIINSDPEMAARFQARRAAETDPTRRGEGGLGGGGEGGGEGGGSGGH